MEDVVIKRCKACGKELPLTSFSTYSKAKDGHRNTCKACFGAHMSAGKTNKLDTIDDCDNDNTGADEFKAYTSRDLILELRRRGYRGKLIYTITKDVII